ncbi:MAG: NAD(P)/FAD-dependent oxidoreductase [Clostridia bacterium]
MREYDVIIIGAGPAGLGAAIELAKAGARPLLIDENSKPGGQLFKQIHKFFGSKEHYAGTRGYIIGENLLKEAAELGVEILLNTRVWGIYPDNSITIVTAAYSERLKARFIIIATGASENALSFPGCTMPGVITAGAAQTFVNIYHVLPGKKVVVVGSGNVGLIVAYQLMQAGAKVEAIIEAMPKISGYAVHAAKVKRAGVPVILSHTIVKAVGDSELEGVIIGKLDDQMQHIQGSEKLIEADTICIAVGLTPRIELAALGNCKLQYSPILGGMLPWHNSNLETSQESIFVAGDVAGIEEASTALDEGRLAGVTVALKLGLIDVKVFKIQDEIIKNRLNSLRQGTFGEKRRKAKHEIWEAKN